MNHRIATSALALALTFCISGASYAAVAPGSGASTTTASTTTQKKAKLVSFNFRNDSATSLVLQAGDQQITVDAGKTSAMKVQEGVQIVAVNAAGHVAAGAVLATVDKMLSGNTIVIN